MSPERIDVGELPEEAHARLIHLGSHSLWGASGPRRRDAAIGNEELDIEFVLTGRVIDRATGQLIDEIELGPNGEGLCMGFHGWFEGDFGSVPI
jgi:hypothetical protein